MAIGPCILLAPVVAALAVLAIPLWPVCLLVLLVALVVVWPIEQVATGLGVVALRGWSATVWSWLRWMSTPWDWFDLPAKKPPVDAAPKPAQRDEGSSPQG